MSFNEILFEFNIRETLSFLIELSAKNKERLHFVKKEQTKDFIAFVNAMIKVRYDEAHTRMKLKIEFMIYLRLHQKYIISNVNDKLAQQRIDSFEII